MGFNFHGLRGYGENHHNGNLGGEGVGIRGVVNIHQISLGWELLQGGEGGKPSMGGVWIFYVITQ